MVSAAAVAAAAAAAAAAAVSAAGDKEVANGGASVIRSSERDGGINKGNGNNGSNGSNGVMVLPPQPPRHRPKTLVERARHLAMDYIMHYIISRELTVANAMRRQFWWVRVGGWVDWWVWWRGRSIECSKMSDPAGRPFHLHSTK